MIRWRQRNIREIMIRRSQGVQSQKQKKCLEEDTNEDGNHQISIRGGQIEVQQIIKIIEQKARVNFYHGFDKKKFQRISIQNATVIEQSFNPLACSYFVISGTIILTDSQQLVKETFDFTKDCKVAKQKILLVQRGQGIGWLFGKGNIQSNCIISNKAVIFRVQHNSFDMKKIQRNCLMTTHEKIDVLKRFKIFSLIDNVHKNLTPFVKPNKLLKGQSIYREGQMSTDFYILIEGEVSFSSTINSYQNPQKLSPISKCQSKKGHKNSIVTYSLSKNSFFGQQQVLRSLCRQETAICSSIECLILIIPGSKLSFLLNVPQIKKILLQSAAMKQQARLSHIKTYLNLPFKAKCQTQQQSIQSNQGFQHLKSTIFFNLFKPSQKSIIKSKYSRDQTKVYHNHSIPAELPLSPTKEPQSPFSMLAVNKQVYEKTLMRFRYSLKEIKGQNKYIQPPHRGRSLQSICKTLKLTQSFFYFNHQQQGQTQQGIAFYNTDKKLRRHIRITKSMKPKNINCNNKLKSQYIDYLQLAI